MEDSPNPSDLAIEGWDQLFSPAPWTWQSGALALTIALVIGWAVWQDWKQS